MSQGWRFDKSIYPHIWPGSLAKIQIGMYKHVTSWVFDKYMTQAARYLHLYSMNTFRKQKTNNFKGCG